MESIINSLPKEVVLTLITSWVIMLLGYIYKIVKSKIEFRNSEACRRFKNWDDANKDISKEMKKSKKLCVLTSRGNFFASEQGVSNPFQSFIRDKSKEILILLPDIYDRCQKQNWIHQRVREMAKLEESEIENDAVLISSIEATINSIRNKVIYSKDCSNREIALFDSLHIGKIVLLDDVGYLQPYYDDKFGREGVVYKYKKNTNMYNWLLRLIKRTRDFSTPINEEKKGLCKEKCALYSKCSGVINDDRG